MKPTSARNTLLRSLIVLVAFIAGPMHFALAQAPVAPADPWPRTIQLSNATVTIYQPQVEAWDGNQIQVRAAVSIKPAGAQAQSFGAVFATARTEVDRTLRTVVFNDVTITKSNFPTLPDQGAAYATELKIEVWWRRANDLARPRGSFAQGRRREGAVIPGQERSAAHHRQQLAGDSGAHRRRTDRQRDAGCESLQARHQYPRADPAGRGR